MERINPSAAQFFATRLRAARLPATRLYAVLLLAPILLTLCATSPPDPTERLALLDFALREEAARGEAQKVAALLAQGAEPNTEDGLGVTPLMIAVVGNIDKFRSMIAAGFGKDVAEVLQALVKAVDGDIPTVQALLKHGADVNQATYRGITPLALAVMGGDDSMVKMLVGAGANLDAQAKRGETALMVAAAAGHTRIAKFLVRNGAETELKTRDGLTALVIAGLAGHWDTWGGIRKAARRRAERKPAQ